MSGYENEDYDYTGYDDPARIDVGDLDPTQLGNVLQQSSALGAQRALSEMAQAQISSQQFDLQQQGHRTWLEAEQALEAADPQWPEKREEAYAYLAAHPTFATQEAIYDSNLAADQLWKAHQYASGEREQAQANAKAVSDNVFGDRLLRAHRQNYSAYRQATDAGESVHDILDGD